MMFIRGNLERKVRFITRENERLLRTAQRLASENVTLRGRVAEMERTLGRDRAEV
jgi:galactokinase